MLSDIIAMKSAEMAPGRGSAGNEATIASNESDRPRAQSKASQNGTAHAPPSSTDKPKPHVCTTCDRRFARLEHLKRHERSHTKEKPFECPECTRCFARRDLLLRHQQKLHTTTTPSSRPRGGRRESTSSNLTAGGKIRKSSMANGAGAATMRPRANTISHVDDTAFGLMAAANASSSQPEAMDMGHSRHPSLTGLPGPAGFSFRGMSNAVGNHGPVHGLPKLETHSLNVGLGGSLRTAPAYSEFGAEYGMDPMAFGPGNTINPAQLHFAESPSAMAFDPSAQAFPPSFSGMSHSQVIMDPEGNFEWINGFENTMATSNVNEHAISNSSPSAMSTDSPGGNREIMLDGSNEVPQSTAMWQPPSAAQAPISSGYPLDMSTFNFSDFNHGLLTPAALIDHLAGSPYLPSPASQSSKVPMTPIQDPSNIAFRAPMVVNPDTPTTFAESTSSSNRQSSVTSVSTELVTDTTRQALLTSLSQPACFGGARKYSQPSVSSPLSPAFSGAVRGANHVSLPSTYDLQRYIAAYVHYFHPHMPFLHIPTLSFDSPAFTSNFQRSNGYGSTHQATIGGGGGSLILAMAAIGALYEYDNAVSKELFDHSKTLMSQYLEERRKADMRKADISTSHNPPNVRAESPVQNTPLWLVQAMLLNVIYGHNCGDKTSADIASTHCAALVSLARAAELARPMAMTESSRTGSTPPPGEDLQMGNDNWTGPQNTYDMHSAWHSWKVVEERKRTLYAVFILSSMLVSAYNHAPALTNSEIRLDLPCSEELWAAESAEAWSNFGGNAIADQHAIPFSSALSSLLTASKRQQFQQHQMSQYYLQPLGGGLGMTDLPQAEFQTSAFGCLVLINALHNYIWETRQRHLGAQWTTQETESMHAHIEPALAAWQAAWASNPQHSTERPNPYGCGPLSADCIPLLDLAYVRLFVSLGRSKEAFWQRDFDAMADELARGIEIIQHADHSPRSEPSSAEYSGGHNNNVLALDAMFKQEPNTSSDSTNGQFSSNCSKRERHLRKAAFHAAHSLCLSDKLGVTFADFNSRELPLQSAMCAYDCAQVLAEWVATVQERVGRYLGILGKDDIDLESIPGLMWVEKEDVDLLAKIEQIINSAELKMSMDTGGIDSLSSLNSGPGVSLRDCGGYGSKILMVTVYMLDSSATWPVTRLMARSLETQAAHMKDRAETSVLVTE